MTGMAVVAVPCGDTLGESAVWSAREGALYWIDIRRPALHRLDPATGGQASWALPDLCGGVALAASGVLLALRHDLAHFDPETAELTHLCSIEPAELGNRLNEAKCDRAGRLWVGSMRDFGAATTGALYRVDPSLSAARVLADITIPNALGWSPVGRTMYFADTRKGGIDAYRFDPVTGSPDGRRVLLAAGAVAGAPDGAAVDSEGHVWTTRFGAGRVVRVAPDGAVSAAVDLPTTQPTSCALGGPGLRTLFITTARQGLDADQLRAQPEAGHLFAAKVPVAGLPEAEFAGPLPARSGRADARLTAADTGHRAQPSDGEMIDVA